MTNVRQKPAARITGKRIYLRPMAFEDVTSEYVSWLNDPEVTRFMEIRFETHTLETAKDYLVKADQNPNALFFAIVRANDNRFIGTIKLGDIYWQHGTGIIALMIGDKQCWGQGYGTETVELLTNYAFKELKMRKLVAGTYENNIGSIKTFLKVGYREEARQHRQYIFDGKYIDRVLLVKFSDDDPEPETNKKLCIIQARMGATRLPGKVLLKVGETALLEYELRRVKLARRIDAIVVATTTAQADDAVAALCERLGIECFRGSEDDVLDRYGRCAEAHPDYPAIVRVTGDCPLIDPRVIDEVIDLFETEKLDYASNVLEETFPDGMDVEVFTREALFKAAQKARLLSEREHVTPYIRRQTGFKKGNVVAPNDFSHIRLTVDEPADFEVVSFLIEHSPEDAGYLDHIALLTKHPDIMLKNMHIKRNEGWEKSLKNDITI